MQAGQRASTIVGLAAADVVAERPEVGLGAGPPKEMRHVRTGRAKQKGAEVLNEPLIRQFFDPRVS